VNSGEPSTCRGGSCSPGKLLTYTLTIRGDPGASTGTTAVWDSFAALADRRRGVQVNSTYQRSVFNRRTGQLLDCCGAAVNDDTRVRQDGIGPFWPIGVRKATYQVFDVNAASAWPARRSTGQADSNWHTRCVETDVQAFLQRRALK